MPLADMFLPPGKPLYMMLRLTDLWAAGATPVMKVTQTGPACFV
jgi:hypothetical protein